MSLGSEIVPIAELGLGLLLMERGVHNPRRDRVEANLLFRVFACKTQSNRVNSALGDHRNRRRNTRDGVVGQRCRNAGHTAAAALRQHLPDRELGDEDESFEVGGNESVKLLGGVVGERLGPEDARVVDKMIDRAKFARSGSAPCSPPSLPVRYLHRPMRGSGDGAKPAFEMLREVATTL